jgi:hypothetical protein
MLSQSRTAWAGRPTPFQSKENRALGAMCMN